MKSSRIPHTQLPLLLKTHAIFVTTNKPYPDSPITGILHWFDILVKIHKQCSASHSFLRLPTFDDHRSEFRSRDNRQYLTFHLFILLRISFCSFTHFAAKDRISLFLRLSNVLLCLYTTFSLSHDGHLSYYEYCCNKQDEVGDSCLLDIYLFWISG